MTAPLILAINPGAGSTKLALYRGSEPEREAKVEHPALAARPAARCWDELPARLADVRAFLAKGSVAAGALAAVVGRGGLLPPMPSGTFAVDAAMLADLERAARGDHASNLGAPLARAVAEEHGCPAFIVDPVSVDELDPVARLTGLAGVERRSLCHALNIRAVARRHAAKAGRPLEELRLVVAHLGTGVSLAALVGGRMVDVVNPKDEGPFSGDRAGGVPSGALMDLCFAPGADRRALERRLFGDGGLFSHAGTRDAREVWRRAEMGDARAALVLDAMAYQIAKAAGGLAAALSGKVDAVLLTGGLAWLDAVTLPVRRRIAFIAPVHLYPGEDELRALAEGALRVLSGQEAARAYRS
ncbi:MAG TPA: butyrate kinase [Anaeromyxobacteraceae bacterium]|nr:butyrate kinase [Anaeromyxobacteraceae bacterium]